MTETFVVADNAGKSVPTRTMHALQLKITTCRQWTRLGQQNNKTPCRRERGLYVNAVSRQVALALSLVVRRRKAYRTGCVFGIFTARCYASAVLAMACVCLSVRLSVTSRCSIKKRMNESSRVLACELPSTRLPEIRLSPKIRALSSGTLS